MGGKPRPLPMEKREDPKKRSTTFSKRRQGLFNKVAELILLCDAKLAVFVSYPSNSRGYKSMGYPSVDSLLDLAIRGGGNAPEGEEERRMKKAGLAMLVDVQADEASLKKAVESDAAFCWDGFSRELDEFVNRGGNLKAMVEILKKTKKEAESKLKNLAESKLELTTGGSGSDGSCNQKQNPEIDNSTGFGSNELQGWSYQQETQPAESDSGFTTTGNGMWTMMPDNTLFVNNAGEFTFQNGELHHQLAMYNQDQMNLQPQAIGPCNAAAVQGYDDDDFNVDDLFAFDPTFNV